MERDEKPGETGAPTELEEKSLEAVELIQSELEDMKGKYLRLYAEFENYKKKVQKDKEEFIKYANENIVYELLHGNRQSGDGVKTCRRGWS